MTRATWLALVLGACGARTQLDTQRPADAAAGDLAPDFVWYRLDETSGTIAHDSSPNHYDVTNFSGVVWNEGAVLDGTVCGSTDVAGAFRTPPITITAWLAPAARDDATSATYALVPFPPDALSGDVPTLGGYGLGLDVWNDGGGGRALAVETGAGAAVAYHSLQGSFDPGAMRFTAVVVSADGADVYVDGVPFDHVSADLPPSAQPTPLHLGCHNEDGGYGSKRFFHGRMRDVRVYRRALGAADIAHVWASGPV
jgi:hypothetical protein